MQEYSSDAFRSPWSAFLPQAEGNLSLFLLNAPKGFKSLFVKDTFLDQHVHFRFQGRVKTGASPPAGLGLDVA
jgi:hypothetical protein